MKSTIVRKTRTSRIEESGLPPTVSATRRKHRLSAVDRRRHLVTVALHLFATRGFRGTTTKSIAEAAGVSEAIIFRHFKSKEDLYEAILHEKARRDDYARWARGLKDFVKCRDDKRVIFEIVLRILQSFRCDPDFHRLMLYAALERPDLAKVGRRILGLPLFRLLMDYVKQRQKEKAFRTGPPEALAFGIMALPMHFGTITEVLGVNTVDTPTEELAGHFTQIILAGLQTPKTGMEMAYAGR